MNFTIDNPIQFQKLVGLRGLGPLTSRLSGVRSNQLSYRPMDCLRVKPSKPNIVLTDVRRREWKRILGFLRFSIERR